MYMHMYIYMYVYMYVCMYSWEVRCRELQSTFVPAWERQARDYVLTFCARMSMLIHTLMYIYMYMCMYVYIYIYSWEVRCQFLQFNVCASMRASGMHEFVVASAPLYLNGTRNMMEILCSSIEHACLFLFVCVCVCVYIYTSYQCMYNCNKKSTAIPIIIEGQFQVFQRFSSSKLVLKTVESCFAALNYYGNGSMKLVLRESILLRQDQMRECTV
jgi:hypothetical protein